VEIEAGVGRIPHVLRSMPEGARRSHLDSS
jgi:hypothetical protein